MEWVISNEVRSHLFSGNARIGFSATGGCPPGSDLIENVAYPCWHTPRGNRASQRRVAVDGAREWHG